MPALALSIGVSGADEASSFVTLTATGTSAAVWDSTTVPGGGSAVRLSATAGSADYAAIVLDTDMAF